MGINAKCQAHSVYDIIHAKHAKELQNKPEKFTCLHTHSMSNDKDHVQTNKIQHYVSKRMIEEERKIKW